MQGTFPQIPFGKRGTLRASASMLTLTASMLAISTQSHAKNWEFSPYVGVEEQFTDNARSSTTDEESDFITTVNVGFSLNGETRRSEFSTSYNISQDYYARNHDLDGYRQRFLGEGTLELLEDKFFIDARATFTEENLGQTGSTSATDRTQAEDRTQVFNGQISPYYIHNFGGWATGIARYSYSETIFSESDVGASSSSTPDRHTNEYQASLTSGRRFAKVAWGVDTRFTASEAEDGAEFSHLLVSGNGQLPLNRLFSLIGTVGYDEFDDQDFDDEEISGVFGGAGVRFHPSSRTDASLQAGYRFGEIVYEMTAEYAPTSADIISSSYKTSVQTADQTLANTDLFDAYGDLVRPEFNVTSYVEDVTKSDRFELSWSRRMERNSYGLSAAYIEREILADDTEDKTISIRGNFGRSLTPRARISFNGGYSEVLEGQTPGDEDKTYTFGANYSYQFGNGLSGSISYNFLNRDNPTGDDLTENALSLSLRKSF